MSPSRSGQRQTRPRRPSPPEEDSPSSSRASSSISERERAQTTGPRRVVVAAGLARKPRPEARPGRGRWVDGRSDWLVSSLGALFSFKDCLLPLLSSLQSLLFALTSRFSSVRSGLVFSARSLLSHLLDSTLVFSRVRLSFSVPDFARIFLSSRSFLHDLR